MTKQKVNIDHLPVKRLYQQKSTQEFPGHFQQTPEEPTSFTLSLRVFLSKTQRLGRNQSHQEDNKQRIESPIVF